MAANQNLKYQANKVRIGQLIKKPHWFLQGTTPTGQPLVLQDLADSGKPLYYSTFNNATSALSTNTDRIWLGGSAGLQLSGNSPLLAGKLGIWDGGAVLASHQEFVGRIVNRDGTTNLSDHATHVAGTMIAAGVNPFAKGMAFQAPDLQSWYFDNDNTEIANAAGTLLLSNHSYGYQAGWMMSGGKWYWLGHTLVSQKDDVYFGYYDGYAQFWDQVAYQAPYYLMVKAAGNSRNNPEPAVGTPYYYMSQETGTWELNAQGRSADMRFYNSYDVIPDHSVAKNILTVGAISPLNNGYSQPGDVVDYVASSYGPTDDGRIKPDLVGSGTNVTSTFSGTNTSYGRATGTSMAAPNITGSLLL
ncbi:MAG: S8 family serine peptidase, partial [Adhaeribacter sp.]